MNLQLMAKHLVEKQKPQRQLLRWKGKKSPKNKKKKEKPFITKLSTKMLHQMHTATDFGQPLSRYGNLKPAKFFPHDKHPIDKK